MEHGNLLVTRRHQITVSPYFWNQEERQESVVKGQEKTFGVMVTLIIRIVVVISQLYILPTIV